MKDSGVEWLEKVPESWDVGAARRFFLFNPSKREISTRPRSEEVSFLPMEAIGETGTLDLTRTRQIKEVETGYSYFANGDVVIAKITPCFENGKGSAIGGLVGGVGFGTTELIVLRPSRHVSQQYSWWLFSAAGFRRFAEGHMEGSAGQKRVQDDWLKAQKVAIPPRPVQDAIVAHLDRATFRIDTLVTKKTRFIELLREKRQALITHAVTKGLDPNVPMKDSGVEWLGKVPETWDTAPLKSFLQLRRDIVGSESSNTKLLSLTLQGVIERDLENLTGKMPASFDGYQRISAGEMVFCLFDMDETPRTVGVAPQDGMLTGAYTVFRPQSELWARYLYYFFLHVDEYKRLRPFYKGLRKTIRPGPFLSIQVPRPTEREAKAIVARLDSATSRIDTLIAKTERSIELLREHRTALITAAVTGKLDLRPAA